MSITERLANLDYKTVIITCLVLLGIRYILLKQKSNEAKWFAEVAESLAVAMALVFLLIRPFIVQAFFIPSASMHPTLLEQDHILVNKFIYRVSQPKHGDVIVFKAPLGATPDIETQVDQEADSRGLKGRDRDAFASRRGFEIGKDFIKRVIGLPGDTVRITPGYVVIGGAQYNHNDLRNALAQYTTADADHKVKITDHMVSIDGHVVTNAELANIAENPKAKVKIVPGTVYIDGKALVEPYTAEDVDEPYPGGPRDLVKPEWLEVQKNGVQVVKIPKGKVLVMGDNRNDSNDARFWGLLDRDRVLGKAMFIFWPFGRVRWVH